MATQTLRAPVRPSEAGSVLGVIIPLFGLLVLAALWVGAGLVLWQLYSWAVANHNQLIPRRLLDPIAFDLQYSPTLGLPLVALLGPAVVVALVYAGWMLVREVRIAGWPWAVTRLGGRALGLLVVIGLCAALRDTLHAAGPASPLRDATAGVLLVGLGLFALAVLVLLVWRLVTEGRSGMMWMRAGLLAVLRAATYFALPAVFLLPGEAMGRTELNPLLWIAVLVLVLVAALVYVIWMYVHDGHTVGALWSVFLAAMRYTLYASFGVAFLLLALQHWEVSNTHSKVVTLFDVSRSTGARDDVPTEALPPEKLPTRQDKVIQLLTDDRVSFLRRLQDKNPVFAYRFGGQLDEDYVVFDKGEQWSRAEWEARAREAEDGQPLPEGRKWAVENWQTWLKPVVEQEPDDLKEEDKPKFRKRLELTQRLLNATNLGDSTLTALNREVNNMVQGIVVFSDGRSTEGAPQAYRDLADRARKAKIPIFVVAIGQDRPPLRIDITDLQAPEQARPEDKFPIRVEVNGEGLPNREITVYLDVYRPGAKAPSLVMPKVVKFKPGEPPHAQAEFEIEAAQQAELAAPRADDKKGKPELEEGEYRFIARVAKDRQEVFLKPEHVSEPATVRIVRRPLRVLLFAGSPSHEYQFVRTLFVRESDQHRAELSIYLQPAPGQTQRRQGIVQDVPPDRLLTQFPYRLADETSDKPDDRLYNLSSYDLIVCFDPDWTELNKEQLDLLERWVGTHAGGLILIGGPVNTVQLARPGVSKEKLKSIIDLYPVVLQDNRIVDLDRDAKDAWRLNFPGATPDMEFLRLDDDAPKETALAGWEEFFTGFPPGQVPPNSPVVRGFYGYYPVEKAKDAATVIATFSDPRARLLATGKEQPYLVTMPYGGGKVVWIGSGEIRRLRQYRESYYERFWTKLARYAGSGNLTRLSRRVVLVMGRTFTANNYVQLEAQVFGRDMQPLAQNARPKVQLKLPPGVTEKEMPSAYEMQAKPGAGEWNGWFTARFLAKAPGEYGLEVKVSETGDSVPGKFQVKEADPEVDNTRPDFDQLYRLASEADDVLARLDPAKRREVQDVLRRPALSSTAPKTDKSEGEGDSEKLRLFFDLKSAELIPDCMVADRRTQQNKGALKDVWDEAVELPDEMLLPLWGAFAGAILLFALVLATLMVVRTARGETFGTVFGSMLHWVLIAGILFVVAGFLWPFVRTLENPAVAVFMLVVIPLFCVEWLSRKLLKLA